MTGGAEKGCRWEYGDWLLLLAIVLPTVLVYAQVAQHQFLGWDDDLYVAANSHLRGGLTWTNVRWAFSAMYAANWHPLTWLSHLLDVSLWGSWAGGHALGNVLFHVLNTALLYTFFRRLALPRWPVALVTALFALHPLHVESVAWISERKDVLCAFCWLLTMHAYVWYAERPDAKRYLLVTLGVAAALLAKPMAVTLPVALLCIDLWPLGRFSLAEQPFAAWWRQARGPLLEKLPWLGLAVLDAGVTMIAQTEAMPADFSFAERYLTVVAAYGSYLFHLFWPVGLHFYYLPRAVASLWLFVPALLGVLLLSVGAWMQRAQRPYLLAGWLWFVLTLVPVVGFIKVGTQAFADRYTYLPLIGVFWMLAWGLWEGLATRIAARWIATGLLLLAVAGLAVLSFRQVATWRTTETLARGALAHDPAHYVAMIHLANTLRLQGRHDEAALHARRALELSGAPPVIRMANEVLGGIAFARGAYAEAIVSYRRALAAEPAAAESYMGIGVALLRLGDLAGAEAALRQALRINPRYSEALNNLGVVLTRQGRGEEALDAYRWAVEADPGNRLARENLRRGLEQQSAMRP